MKKKVLLFLLNIIDFLIKKMGIDEEKYKE